TLFRSRPRRIDMIDLLSTSPALFTACALVLGLLVGSFLNVVIHRLPIMMDRQWREQCEEIAGRGPDSSSPRERFDLLVPRSVCPSCHAPIRAIQNVPLVSYVLLGGRCAACGTAISVRYPIVEALTGVLSAAVAW